MEERFSSVELLKVAAGPASIWLFVLMTTTEGLRGLGEATVPFNAEIVARYLAQYFDKCVHNIPVQDASAALAALRRESNGGELARAAAISSLEQAVLDTTARAQSKSTSALLGPPMRNSARVYANINRGLVHRTPESFAAAADAAAKAGFTAVKCAPFDGVTGSDDTADRGRLAVGMERIYAARSALPPSAELYVDCHGRLNRSQAVQVAEMIAGIGITWFEEPLATHPTMMSVQHERDNRQTLELQRREAQGTQSTLADRRYVADCAHDLGLRIAGGEFYFGIDQFSVALDEGVLDVVMPDVKYCGGATVAFEISKLCARYGAQFAPHNPSGPLGLAVSLQVCRSAPSFEILELQIGGAEDEARERTIVPALQMTGSELIIPTGDGHGVDLRDNLLAQTGAERIAWLDV